VTNCGEGGEENALARVYLYIYIYYVGRRGEVFGETTAVRMAEGSSGGGSSAEYPPPAC